MARPRWPGRPGILVLGHTRNMHYHTIYALNNKNQDMGDETGY